MSMPPDRVAPDEAPGPPAVVPFAVGRSPPPLPPVLRLSAAPAMPPGPVPAAIIDYASPRPQGRYRLPSLSRLDVVADRDGLTITEVLEGKASAYAGMAVGVFTLLLLPTMAYLMIAPMFGRARSPDAAEVIVVAALYGGLWVADLVVLLMVVNNTWRRTILRARDRTLSLEFIAPFTQRRYAWPFDQIVDLYLDRIPDLRFVNPHVELVFRAADGQSVRLFADHREPELEAVVRALYEALAGPAGTPAGAGHTILP